MTTPVSHPLVGAYLRELDRLLRGVEPGERAEVLSGVHEHLDARLPPGASDDDVRRTLDELGAPQSVADEAYAGRTPTPAPVAPVAPVAAASSVLVGSMSRGWVPAVVGILLALALLMVVLVVGAGSGYGVSGTETMGADGQLVRTTEIEFDGAAPFALLGSLLLTLPLWLPATVLAMRSPLWTSGERWALALVVPLTAVLLALLPVLGWTLTGTELGINAGAWLGLALGLLGGGTVLLRLVRAGSRRATAALTGAS